MSMSAYNVHIWKLLLPGSLRMSFLVGAACGHLHVLILNINRVNGSDRKIEHPR